MISLKHRVFTTQNEPCISCTRNHCVQRRNPTKHEFHTKTKLNEYLLEINVTFVVAFEIQVQKCVASLGKYHSHMIFATKSVLLVILISTNLKKDCTQRYVVTNGVSISRALLAVRGYGTIW